MVTKAATRLLVVAIAAAFVGPGRSRRRRGPSRWPSDRASACSVATPSTSVWSDGRPTRFETRGLGVPTVDVHFHPDTSGCYGHLGSELGRPRRRVRGERQRGGARDAAPRDGARVDRGERHRLGARAVHSRCAACGPGTRPTVPWDDRGFEHGAEIIAWGLGNRYMAPSIPDRDPAGLAAGFEFLTRVPFPNPSETSRRSGSGRAGFPPATRGSRRPGTRTGRRSSRRTAGAAARPCAGSSRTRTRARSCGCARSVR